MLSRTRVALALGLGGLLVPLRAAPARAQTGNVVAIGAVVSVRAAAGPQGDGRNSIGPLWRLGHGREGWGWHYGLDWFSVGLDRSIAGAETYLGELHVRPIMAGYGYTVAAGPAMASLDVLGGYAFTSFHLEPTANDRYRDRLGAQSVAAHAGNTFVVRPELNVWIDLSRKIGLNLNAGYALARPEVTIASSLGPDAQRMRADVFAVKFGLAYAVF